MSREAKRIQPGVEALEDRALPSNFLVLDFSPDRGSGVSKWFSDAFTEQPATRRALRLLDMNHNGRLDAGDVSKAARLITQRVAQYFQGFDITVLGGDVVRDTRLGSKWLDRGVASATDQVFVSYVGGDGPGLGIIGEAIQPPVGQNNEDYGHAYASTIVDHLLDVNGGRTELIDQFAQVIAHETGHLLGVGHVKGNPRGDPNIMNYSVAPAQASFPDTEYRQIELKDASRKRSWGTQNPAQEVRESLQGQPTWNGVTFRRFFRPAKRHHHQVPGAAARAHHHAAIDSAFQGPQEAWMNRLC